LERVRQTIFGGSAGALFAFGLSSWSNGGYPYIAVQAIPFRWARQERYRLNGDTGIPKVSPYSAKPLRVVVDRKLVGLVFYSQCYLPC